MHYISYSAVLLVVTHVWLNAGVPSNKKHDFNRLFCFLFFYTTGLLEAGATMPSLVNMSETVLRRARSATVA